MRPRGGTPTSAEDRDAEQRPGAKTDEGTELPMGAGGNCTQSAARHRDRERREDSDEHRRHSHRRHCSPLRPVCNQNHEVTRQRYRSRRDPARRSGMAAWALTRVIPNRRRTARDLTSVCRLPRNAGRDPLAGFEVPLAQSLRARSLAALRRLGMTGWDGSENRRVPA